MAEVTMELIKALREKTGSGIALCKEALVATGADIEEAITYIRKKDAGQAAKKAERATGQGVVLSRQSADGSVGVIIEVACETDFVAKNEMFQTMCNNMLDAFLAAEDVSNAPAIMLADGKTVEDSVKSSIAIIGENMKFRGCSRLKAPAGGVVGIYNHFNQKAASLVALSLENLTPDADAVKAICADVCMHITSVRPNGLSADDIPEEAIAREREVYMDEIKDKPAEMQEKILQGKLGRFFASQCLAEQKFVKDEKVTVKKMIEDAAKAAGGSAAIVGFVRAELGSAPVCINAQTYRAAE